MPTDVDDDGPVPDDPRYGLFQRLGDVELLRRLRKGGCVGPDWLVVRGVLTGYVMQTVHKLVLNGEINLRTARLGRPARLTHVELAVLREQRTERDSLVDDAVAIGMGVFRTTGILDGGWRPDGKASLRTYAVNGCLMQIGGAVKRWRGTRPEEQCCGAGAELDEVPAFAVVCRDVADEVVDRIETRRRIEELLAGVGEPLRSAIVLRLVSDGTRSWKDIAVELDVSERVLEAGLRRLRGAGKGQCRNRPSGIGRDEEIDRDQ